MSEELDKVDEDARARNKVILNVGGMRHETFVGTLGNIPDSRLSSLIHNNPTQVPEFDQNSGEFFFDRHPLVFAQILNYYRTGKLHCPSDVCGPVFEEELAFWGLEDASIETCCWMNYKKHGEAQANLSSFDKIIEDAASEHESIFCDERNDETPSLRDVLRKYRSRVWVTLEEPSSSLTAKMIALLSMLLIITSVIVSCLETMEYFSQSTQHQVLHILEVICIAWFTAEFVIRFTVSPKKRKFLKQIMNWVDFAAIVPFYIQLFLTNADMNSMLALRIVRLIRVFRVFKLSRHSYSLQILGHTLKSSLSELFLLVLFLGIGVVVFSTLMFYAEHGSENLEFTSIPAGFWWAVVTMTTLGYGDIVPHTITGRLVGSACAVSGVLMIALPIPVIVSNFSLYYSHAKAKQKVAQRKRPIVIGAANALKVIDPFLGSRATNLRLSVMSDNASCVSPVPPARAFSKNIQRMGSSVEGSESPASQRRRMSRLPDKLWQIRTLELRNSEQYKNNSSKTSDDILSGKDSEDSSKFFQRNFDPRGSEDLSTPEWQFSNSMSATFNAGEEKTVDGADDNGAVERMSDIDHSKVNAKYDEDTDNGSDKDNTSESKHQSHSIPPKIEVMRHSSTSQMSGSNSDTADKFNDETKSGKKSNKKTKKLRKSRPSVEKATSAPTLGAQVPKKNPPGRMGRRGSVFVVGFLGKRWQAKAARSRMKRMRRNSKLEEMQLSPVQHHKTQLHLLHVSPSLSNRSATNDDSRRTSTTSFTSPNSTVSLRSSVFRFPLPVHQTPPKSTFPRRSSCPDLFTPKVVQNVQYNNQNPPVIYQTDGSHKISKDFTDIDEICSKFHEVREVDGENEPLGVRKNNIRRAGENSSDIKHPAESIKDINNSDTKHNGNDKKAEDDTTDNRKGTRQNIHDTKHNRQGTERNGTDMNSKNEGNTHTNVHNYNIDSNVDDMKENGDNTKNKENFQRSRNKHYETKDEIKRKQDTLGRKRWSLSSQSNYSSKASSEETTRRYSAPLIRQKAVRSIKGREEGQMKSRGGELRRSRSKNAGTCSAQIREQDFNKTSETASRDNSNNKMKTFSFDSNAVKSGCSTITWVEIGTTQPSNRKCPNTDKMRKYDLKTLETEYNEHAEYKNTSSNQARSFFDPVHRISENTTRSDGETIQAIKEIQTPQNILTKQETPILEECKYVFEPDERNKKAKNGRPGAKFWNSFTNDTETSLNHHPANLGNEPRDDRNASRIEVPSERFESDKAHIKFLNSFEYNNTSEDQSNNFNLNLHQENAGKRQGMRINGHDHIFHRNCQNNMTNDFDREYSGTKNYSCINSNSAQSRFSKAQPEKRQASNAVKKDNMDLIYPNHNPEKQMHSLKTSMNSKTIKHRSWPLSTVHRDQNTGLRRDNEHDLSYPIYNSRKSGYPGGLAPLLDTTRNSHLQKDHWTSAEHKDENIRIDNGKDAYDYNTEQTERLDDALNISMHSQFTSSQDSYTMERALSRNLEAQDSGICCMDRISSIDSSSSFTERNYDRQILKTISEVELDSDDRDGMIYHSFPCPYHEKSRLEMKQRCDV